MIFGGKPATFGGGWDETCGTVGGGTPVNALLGGSELGYGACGRVGAGGYGGNGGTCIDDIGGVAVLDTDAVDVPPGCFKAANSCWTFLACSRRSSGWPGSA